jgi:hypothetical protein
MWQQLLNISSKGRPRPPVHVSFGLQHDTQANGPKDSGATPWMNRTWYWGCTGAIGEIISFAFHTYVEHQIWTPYVTWASFFCACCSWNLRWARTWIALGVHLGDLNWIRLEPPSLLGHPCWTPLCPLHKPILIVCMCVISSSHKHSKINLLPLYLSHSILHLIWIIDPYIEDPTFEPKPRRARQRKTPVAD